MKNADMPAMPTSPNDRDPEWAAARSGGLTKREMFAMTAMQGLLVNMGRNGFDNVNAVALEAVNAADAMLKNLEHAK